jgi:hypothetical protein
VTGWHAFRLCLIPVRLVMELGVYAAEQALDVLEQLERA